MTTIIYAFNDKKGAKTLISLNKRNLLISYYYLKFQKNMFELLDLVKNHEIFMLDSGAFSAWNSGKPILLYDYIDFIKQCHSYFTHIICLDVIDNPILSEVNHLIMLEELKDYGLTIIPVFHSGESFAVLDYMVEKGYKYLGISPNNNWQEREKREWLTRVFNRYDFEKLGVKTHGFGYQSTDGLEYFPLTTADSTSWRVHSGYGRIIAPHFAYLRYSDKSLEDNIEDMVGGHPQFVTNLCNDLGISLSDLKDKTESRVRFNIEAIDRLSIRSKKNISNLVELFDEGNDGSFTEEKVLTQLEICLKMGKEYKGNLCTDTPQKKSKRQKPNQEEKLF